MRYRLFLLVPTRQPVSPLSLAPRLPIFVRSGDGVDRFEFVIGMLTKLQVVYWHEVSPLLKLFECLDRDGSGVLNRDDLMDGISNSERPPQRAAAEQIQGSMHPSRQETTSRPAAQWNLQAAAPPSPLCQEAAQDVKVKMSMRLPRSLSKGATVPLTRTEHNPAVHLPSASSRGGPTVNQSQDRREGVAAARNVAPEPSFYL